MHVSSDLERIGDHAENIIQLAEVKMEDALPFSPTAILELEHLFDLVDSMLAEAITAFDEEDIALAQKVIDRDDHVDFLERSLRKNHIQRLNQKRCIPQSGVIYLDLISNLERVADHATNLAEVVTGDF
jgi:phosphate:Na+ symporter